MANRMEDARASVLDSIIGKLNEKGCSSSTLKPSNEESIADGPSKVTSDNAVVTKNGPEGSRPVLRDGMTAPRGAARGEAAEDMNQLKRQVSALTSLIQESIVPVVKTLKRAYDDSMGDEPCESLDHLSDQEAEEGDSDAESPPVSKKPKMTDGECSASMLKLLNDVVIKPDKSSPPVSEKWAEIIQKIASSGLTDEIRKERMEEYHPPENTPLLTAPRVQTAIWNHADSTVNVRDTAIRKALDVLVAAIVPVVNLADLLRRNIDNDTPLPPTEEMWKAVSDAAILGVTALHELNVVRRDGYKPGMDHKYKSLCSTKNQPIGVELFGDNVTDKIKELEDLSRSSQKLNPFKPKAQARPGIFNKKPQVSRKPFLGRGYRTDHQERVYNRPYPQQHSQTTRPHPRGRGRQGQRQKM